jgi:hypothetical protein
MPTTNVFLNSYQQPENKLTYSFLCLLEHLNVSATALLEKIGRFVVSGCSDTS